MPCDKDESGGYEQCAHTRCRAGVRSEGWSNKSACRCTVVFAAWERVEACQWLLLRVRSVQQMDVWQGVLTWLLVIGREEICKYGFAKDCFRIVIRIWKADIDILICCVRVGSGCFVLLVRSQVLGCPRHKFRTRRACCTTQICDFIAVNTVDK